MRKANMFICSLACLHLLASRQERFRGILAAGDLRDAWRQLHPGEHGGMTWRGATWVRRRSLARSTRA